MMNIIDGVFDADDPFLAYEDEATEWAALTTDASLESWPEP